MQFWGEPADKHGKAAQGQTMAAFAPPTDQPGHTATTGLFVGDVLFPVPYTIVKRVRKGEFVGMWEFLP